MVRPVPLASIALAVLATFPPAIAQQLTAEEALDRAQDELAATTPRMLRGCIPSVGVPALDGAIPEILVCAERDRTDAYLRRDPSGALSARYQGLSPGQIASLIGDPDAPDLTPLDPRDALIDDASAPVGAGADMKGKGGIDLIGPGQWLATQAAGAIKRDE